MNNTYYSKNKDEILRKSKKRREILMKDPKYVEKIRKYQREYYLKRRSIQYRCKICNRVIIGRGFRYHLNTKIHQHNLYIKQNPHAKSTDIKQKDNVKKIKNKPKKVYKHKKNTEKDHKNRKRIYNRNYYTRRKKNKNIKPIDKSKPFDNKITIWI